MEKKENRIEYILIQHNLSGVEKRFINLFKHFYENKQKYNLKVIAFLSRAIVEESKLGLKQNPDFQIIVFGLSKKVGRYFSKVPIIWRFIDLLHLFIILLCRCHKGAVIHFVNVRSHIFWPLFKNNRKVFTIYNSTLPLLEKFCEKPYLQRVVKNNSMFDCLDDNIANTFKSHLKFDQVIYTSPCSFIDMSNTEYKYSEKRNIITFAGRFIPIKGIDILTEILCKFDFDIVNYTFVVLGHGPLKYLIENVIANRKISEKVLVTHTDNPKEYFLKTKIFLSLQKHENYPSQSLLEAMACGNAIIATDVGLTHKLVDSTNGFRIKNADNALSMIKQLTSNENKLEKYCYASREKVKATQTVDCFAKYIISLYNK